MLVLALVFELRKPFTDSVFRQRTHPQTFHRTFATCLLIDPTLNQLSLLPGITAVNHLIGLRNQTLDHIKLLVYTLISMHFDGETCRNHRQRTQAPCFPLLRIFLRIEQRAEMTECPSNLVSVPFKISVLALISSQHSGDVLTHGRFLCYANDHRNVRFKNVRCMIYV